MANELVPIDSTKEEYFKLLTESSGKMILLDKLLDKFRGESKKVLIFS